MLAASSSVLCLQMCIYTGINVFTDNRVLCTSRHTGACAYKAELKPVTATAMTPIHHNGLGHQAYAVSTYSSRPYSKAACAVLSKTHFVFKVLISSVSL